MVKENELDFADHGSVANIMTVFLLIFGENSSKQKICFGREICKKKRLNKVRNFVRK